MNIAMIESTKAFRDFAGNKSWQQLDFQTQQTVRYFAILEQAASKYGLELAQNTTSRQAAFVAQLKNAQLALGQAFLPIYNVILPALTRFATALANVMNTIAQFTQALFGYDQAKQQTKATEVQAGAVAGLGNAYEKAGKQAKGAVAGFDKLNLVGQTSAGAGGAAAGGLVPEDTTGGPLAKMGEQMKEVSQKAREMAEKVRSAFGSMSQFIREHSDLIIAALAGLAAGFVTYLVATNWPAIIGGITTAFKGLRTAILTTWLAATGPVGLVVAAIGLVTTALVYLYRTNEDFRNAVNAAWESIVTTISKAGKSIWGFIGPLITDLVKFMIEEFNQFREQWNEIWPSIQQAFVNIWNGIMAFIRPVVNAFVELMKWAWPFIKALIIGTFEAIKGVISGAFDIIIGLLKVFSGLFTADWKLMWEGLKQLVTGALEFIFNAFQLWGVTKFIGVAVKGFAGLLRNAFKSLADDIVNIFKGMGNGINGVWNWIKNMVKNSINFLIDSLNKFIGGYNKIAGSIPKADLPFVGKVGLPTLPKLPRLAMGGLAFGPTLAMVGDNRNAGIDPEVIAPLSKLESMMGGGNDNRELVTVMRQILQAVRENRTVQAVIERDSVGRAAIDYVNDERRRGRNPLLSP